MGAALGLALLLCLPAKAFALEASELVPGGDAVGIQLQTDGVMVVGVNEVQTETGPATPAADAGIKSGDVIRSVGEWRTACAADFLTAMSAADGGMLRITAERNGREVQFNVYPARNRDGAWQLGLWLRDGVSGIGTVTFYDPNSGVFGALGHGINDVETGELVQFDAGSITDAEVVDVIRGAAGTPGELCGQFDKDDVLGSLEKNTDSGIFGTAGLSGFGEPVPVAREDEVVLGPAVIRSNVSGGEVKEYAVEISRIYRDSDDNRFMLLTVTDEALLERTGGIVQGM